MSRSPSLSTLEAFFADLRDRRAGLLALDYDGTLAPFRDNRFEAVPDPSLKVAVEAIARQGRTTIVIVSGRPAREVVAVAGFETAFEVWGCHGCDHLDLDGRWTSHGPAAEIERALDDAAAAIAGRVPANAIEVKIGSVLLHWRALDPAQRPSLESLARAAWTPLTTIPGLELTEFNGGLELRTTVRTKGDALRDVLAAHGQGRAAAFLGDDVTDEDGFAAIDGHGLGVLVRNDPRPTRAHHRVTMPAGIRDFLLTWYQCLDSPKDA